MFTQFDGSSHCLNFFMFGDTAPACDIYFSYIALGGWLILETFQRRIQVFFWKRVHSSLALLQHQ